LDDEKPQHPSDRLTLRDQFAMAALPAVFAKFQHEGSMVVTRGAYLLADAMMKARK
jgi:hypothetical protein